MEGWIKLHRKLSNKAFYSKDSEKVHLWIHLLMRASHQGREELFGGKPIQCDAGQFTTGRKQLAEQTGIDESKIERMLTYFEKIEQQIEQQKSSTNRLISIVNWCDHQTSEQQSEQQVNNDRTTSEQQVNNDRTHFKNVKNKENERMLRNKTKTTSKNDADEGEFYLTSKKKRLKGKRLATFLIFWDKFNYKKSKADAADAWMDIPVLTDEICLSIYKSAEIEAKNRIALVASGKTPKMAQGWISGRRWEDEDAIIKVRNVKEEVKKTKW